MKRNYSCQDLGVCKYYKSSFSAISSVENELLTFCICLYNDFNSLSKSALVPFCPVAFSYNRL